MRSLKRGSGAAVTDPAWGYFLGMAAVLTPLGVVVWFVWARDARRRRVKHHRGLRVPGRRYDADG